MNEDRVIGAAKEVGGKMEEGLGQMTGDSKTRVRGMARQAEGVMQEISGQAGETAHQAFRVAHAGAREADDFMRRTIEGRPYMTAAIALGIGYLLGRIMRGR